MHIPDLIASALPLLAISRVFYMITFCYQFYYLKCPSFRSSVCLSATFNGNAIFLALIKIEVCFFSVLILLIYHELSIYSINIMSVGLSKKGINVKIQKRLFLGCYLRLILFCVHIPLVYEHLFYKYFVLRSVGQATKGKRASLLIDVVILVIFVDKQTKIIVFSYSLRLQEQFTVKNLFK